MTKKVMYSTLVYNRHKAIFFRLPKIKMIIIITLAAIQISLINSKMKNKLYTEPIAQVIIIITIATINRNINDFKKIRNRSSIKAPTTASFILISNNLLLPKLSILNKKLI